MLFSQRMKNIYPWIVWGLASCFLFYKYLLQVSPSVMVPDLMKTFSLSGLSMGNLAAFYFYAYLSMQLPVGILLDKYNPRRLITAAVIVCAFGALLFSRATHLMTAELGRLLIGLGGAFSAVGTMKLISLWFPPQKFALVSGLMMTVGMLGAVGGEAPLSYMVIHLGWRQTMLIAAIAGFVLALGIGLIVRDKKSADQQIAKRSFKEFYANLLKILKSRQSWFISLYSGLAFAPVSAFAGLWGIPYLMEKYDCGRYLTATLVSLVFMGFAVGSPFAGWLSDHINRRKPIMIVGTTCSVVLLMVILYAGNVSIFALGTLLFVFGLFSGFFFVSFAYMREINASHLSGTSIGFINMFNAACGALSEPLIGKLLDMGWDDKVVDGVRIFSHHDYQRALLVLPIAMALGIFLLFFIPETRCNQRPVQGLLTS